MPAPIKGDHYLTQAYGATQYAITSGIYSAFGNIHPGLDFGTHGKKLPAISTVPGEVVMATKDGGWGNHVGVLGEDGWIRQWCHLDKISVKVGDRVEIGTELGLVGTTGQSTGVHLHYGNRKLVNGRWQYRNPSNDLKDTPMPQYEQQLIQLTEDGVEGSGTFAYVQNGKKRIIRSNGDRAGLAALTLLLNPKHALTKKAWDKIPTGADF